MTTKYYTVNGMLLYESTAGVRTEYVHDALGSVIATTDSTRKVQNTYRWAGYGTQISKTGTAADPKFLWNGTSGYRASGRAHASHYVRRRNYSYSEGSWCSVDHFWLKFGPFCYALQAPQDRADPTGAFVHIFRRPKDPGKLVLCGDWFSIRWNFSVDGGPDSMWLIQHVEIYYAIQCCQAKPYYKDPGQECPPCQTIQNSTGGFKTEYYEAWWVKFGTVMAPGVRCPGDNPMDWVYGEYDDQWNWGGCDKCWHGSILVRGSATLVTNLPPEFKPCNVGGGEECALALPSSCSYTGTDWQAPGLVLYNCACCKDPAASNKTGDCGAGCDGPCYRPPDFLYFPSH